MNLSFDFSSSTKNVYVLRNVIKAAKMSIFRKGVKFKRLMIVLYAIVCNIFILFVNCSEIARPVTVA